jgi:hypothetical protein
LLEIKDVNFLAYLIRRLGQLAWREGEREKAIELCAESLKLNQEVSDIRGAVACLAGFAAIAAAQGRFERAAQLMGSVETQLDLIGIRLLYVDKIEYERTLAVLQMQVDEKTLGEFWARGKAMTFEQAVVFALAEK